MGCVASFLSSLELCMMVMCKSLLKIFIAERVEQEMRP